MATPFQVERGIAMNSGAPGGFECETFIAAWAQGAHTKTAIRHINECPYCRAMIHGEADFLKPTEEQDANLAQHFAEEQELTERGFVPLPKAPWPNHPDPKAQSCFEELKLRFAQELETDVEATDNFEEIPPEQKTRATTKDTAVNRRYMLSGLAAVAGLMVVGGAGFFFGTQAKGVDPGIELVAKRLEINFKSIDAIDASKGRPGIVDLFNAGSLNEVTTLVSWISRRNQTAYFDILASATLDNRVKVKYGACGACRQAAPIDLKPFVISIETAAQLEANQIWKQILQELVQRVNDA